MQVYPPHWWLKEEPGNPRTRVSGYPPHWWLKDLLFHTQYLQ